MKVANILFNNKVTQVLVENGKFYPSKNLDFDVFPIEYDNFSKVALPIEEESEIKWLPPVLKPSKIIAIGLNYMDHITESKGALPKNPIIFAKYPNSLIGHRDFITWDKNITNKVDYEAELAVVIGRKAKDIGLKEARSIIAGYCCANDVSARDLQFGDGQWTRGKSLDSFCPLGPYLVTPDEIADPQNLSIKSILNGTVMQDSNTSHMIFSVEELISFLSRHFTLLPGDIILTGTPSGVGAFRDPPVYLKDGDEIIISIDSVGELVNHCKAIGG